MTRQQAVRLRLRAIEERRSATELAGRLTRLRSEHRDDPTIMAQLEAASFAAADAANQLDQLIVHMEPLVH